MKFSLGIPGTSYKIHIDGQKPGKNIKHSNSDKPTTTGLMRFSPLKLTTRPKWATQDKALADWAEGKTGLINNTPISSAERSERREVARLINDFNNNKKETVLNIQDKKLISTLPPIPAKTEFLYINECKSLREVPDISSCSNLRHIDLSWNPNMPVEANKETFAKVKEFKCYDRKWDMPTKTTDVSSAA